MLSQLAVLTGESPNAQVEVVQAVRFALSLLHRKNVTAEDQPAALLKVAKKRLERGIRDVLFKSLVVER